MTDLKAYTGCDYASLYYSRVRERIAEEISTIFKGGGIQEGDCESAK